MEFRALSYRSFFPLNLKNPLSGTWKQLRFTVRLAMYIGVAAILGVHCVSAYTQTSTQTGEWTWIGGSSAIGIGFGPPGIYGTLGVADPRNIPGGRSGQVSWTDSNGNLWLFGGYGIDASGGLVPLCDLWKFDSSTKEWAWMSGSSSGRYCPRDGNPSSYGVLGTPSPGTNPPARQNATGWIDQSSNLWLFGGTDGVSELNDLWEFNPSINEWAWMGGSNSPNNDNQGVYGTLGIPAVGNVPGARDSATGWTDTNGNFWLFGGYGLVLGSLRGRWGYFNDLWEFNPSTGEWAWMGGSSTSGSCGGSLTPDPGCSHGVSIGLGIPDSQNVPGGRTAAAGSIDDKGNLWLFGGYGSDLLGFVSWLNDLWKFSPTTNEWTWVAGSGTLDAVKVPGTMGRPDTWIVSCPPHTYGTLGVYAPGNVPGCREYASTWNSNGIFWLFGGSSASTSPDNDFWGFNPLTGEWAWMGGTGDNANAVAGIYGTAGIPASGNAPGTRYGATRWADASGGLWLFGGWGADSRGKNGYLDDVWEYTPPSPPSAAVPMPSFSPKPGQYLTGQTVAINDSMPGTTIYYTTDGTWPTTNSAVYGGPLVVSATETLKAIAAEVGYNDSGVTTAVFTINPELPAPTFSPPAGTYTGTQVVSIIEAPLDITIYYTTDGTNPTTSSAVYSSPIAVSHTEQIKALATAQGSSISAAGSALYRIKLPMPIFSPPSGPPTSSGTYSPPLSVQISDSTPGTTIYFTMDGTTPTKDSEVYSAPISVSTNVTLKAFATISGVDDSDVATASYTPDELVPWFNPPGGLYLPPLTVNIANGMPNSTICYTTDGSTPTTNSSVVTGLITLKTPTTLKAFATGGGRSSAVTTATYTFVQYVTGISLPATASISIGSKTTLIATVVPANATFPALNWASSNRGVATVDFASGVIKGISEGTTQITALSEDGSGIVSNICTVTVLPVLVNQISLSATASVSVGLTTTIPVTISPSNTTNQVLSWASSNPNVASVNASGVVTGVSNGTTQITAVSTDGSGITSNICTVTVDSPFTVGPSTPSGNTATVKPGGTAIYSLVLTPVAGTTLLSPVTFSATGLPAGATAAFAPGTVVAGSGTTSLSLSIQTLAAAAHSERTFRTPVSLLCVLLLPIAGMCWRKRTGSSFHLMSSVLFLALMLIIALAMSACSGKGGGAGGGGGKSPVSSTITVIASNGQVQATTEVVLTIQ